MRVNNQVVRAALAIFFINFKAFHAGKASGCLTATFAKRTTYTTVLAFHNHNRYTGDALRLSRVYQCWSPYIHAFPSGTLLRTFMRRKQSFAASSISFIICLSYLNRERKAHWLPSQMSYNVHLLVKKPQSNYS